MMRPAEHANLIGIFSWILAGIQGFVFLFFALYVVIFGGLTIAAMFGPKNQDTSGLLVLGIVVGVFALLALFGLVCLIANIWIGRRLRSADPPSQRSVVVMAILNFCSFLCGGLMIWPFGIALGVYQLWFALSIPGKAFLGPREFSSVLNASAQPQPYLEPHGWQ